MTATLRETPAPGDPVTGRRWGEATVLTGWMVELWGTNQAAMLIELPSGERDTITVESARRVGRHSMELQDACRTAVVPDPDDEDFLGFEASAAEHTASLEVLAEQTEITPSVGEVDPETTAWMDLPVWPFEQHSEPSGSDPDDEDEDEDPTRGLAWPRLRAGIEWARRNWTVTRVAVVAACVGAALAETIGWVLS